MHTALYCGGFFVSNKNLCLRLELNLSLCSVKFLISSVLEAGYDTSED